MTFLDSDMRLGNVPSTKLVAAVVKRRHEPRKKRASVPFARRGTTRLIADLDSHSTRSFDDRVTSAMIVRELRERVEAGLMGNVTWYSWAKKTLKLGPTRLKEHMRVARARNPAAEVERLMKLAETRAQRHDENEDRKAAAEWERKAVIDFATKAPIEQVRLLYRTVSKMPKLP